MKKILWLVRKGKALFIKWKMHRVFSLFTSFFMLLSYLTRLSKWISSIEKPSFNDFYAKKHVYNKRYELYKHVIAAEDLQDIYYLEFGVSEGHSFLWWAQQIKSDKSRFAGFDTFSGLPENWGVFSKGAMSVSGELPKIEDSRCLFVKGLFQDSLPGFLQNFRTEMRKVIHCDADIYSSTLFVLTAMAPFLHKDDIIIFDEFNVPLHEFRAFSDFVNSYYIKTKMIGAVNNYFQVAFKIIE